MSTVIYPSPIFGPVHSRRLGVSLGINLLPEDGKFLYLRLHLLLNVVLMKIIVPKRNCLPREQVREALEARLIDMRQNGP